MAAPQYRANAMAHLSSPEQLDTLVRVTRPRGWIALAAVGLVIAAFVTWTLVGTVQTTVPGPGVLLTQYGASNTVATTAGQVTELFSSAGDEVAAGQRLASVAADDGDVVTITAQDGGRVEEVLAFPGDRVQAGTSIATIQPVGQKLYAFVYVRVDGTQPVKVGMPVQLSVTTVPAEQYGLLLGTVTKVGSFPVTRAGVNALLNNDDITALVIAAAPVVQVQIELTSSPSTPSGFAWTSGVGPPESLSAGTLVNSTIITAVQRPITLLVPEDRAPG